MGKPQGQDKDDDDAHDDDTDAYNYDAYNYDVYHSGHDMIHRSMLIMYDQQCFMAMINDHSI